MFGRDNRTEDPMSRFEHCRFRISDLLRISIFEFRIFPAAHAMLRIYLPMETPPSILDGT